MASIAYRVQIAIPGHGFDDAGKVHLADADAVGDEEIPRRIESQIARVGHQRFGRQTAIAGESWRAGSCLNVPGAASGVDSHDIGRIRHINVPGGIQSHGDWCEQSDYSRPAKHGGNDAARHDLADALVLRIGDVEIAGAVHSEPRRIRELRVYRQSAIAVKSGQAGAGDGNDPAVGRHLANAVAVEFGYVEIARGIHSDVARRIQLRVSGQPAVA
jgi:hypothetical protein